MLARAKFSEVSSGKLGTNFSFLRMLSFLVDSFCLLENLARVSPSSGCSPFLSIFLVLDKKGREERTQKRKAGGHGPIPFYTDQRSDRSNQCHQLSNLCPTLRPAVQRASQRRNFEQAAKSGFCESTKIYIKV